MEPSTERLPFVARVDDSTGPGDVIDALSLAGSIAGTQPWARSVRLQQVRGGARLLPAGVEPARVALGSNSTTHLAEGAGWTLRAIRWRDRTADLTVTAASEELGERIIAEATEGAVAPRPSADDKVAIGFWHRNPHGAARRVERSVAALGWPAIRRNYARSVATAFDEVAALEPERLGGRLLLLHGPPGTGKTTALRALHRLHPAVTRPGRCLAQVHVGRLPRAEALAWLDRPHAPPAGLGADGATLAELFALRGDVRQVDLPEPDRRVGQYL